MKNALCKWLNSSLLPKWTSVAEKAGLYAEFFADGQLKHLGIYQNGSSDEHWTIGLEHAKEKGRAECVNGSGGTIDSNVYVNGKAEQFDAWSDNSLARPVPFRDWAEQWIKHIVNDANSLIKNQMRSKQTKDDIGGKGKRKVIYPVK